MKPDNKKIVFFGTSEYATKPLEALVNSGTIIAAAIIVPDKPAGRGLIMKQSPVKICAQKLGLKILQPVSLKELDTSRQSLIADLAIIAAYGKIIPQAVMDIFPLGIINLHPSLLPKYRGPSPIQYALLNGDKETGVTIIKIDNQIDHGSIVAQRKLKKQIDKMKYEELLQELSGLSADLLLETLPKYLNDEIKPTPQDDRQATFTKMIEKKDGKIDWNKSVQEIYNQFRAFHNWPGLWTTWKGKFLKITDCQINNGKFEILKLQLEGKKEISLKDFNNGHRDFSESELK